MRPLKNIQFGSGTKKAIFKAWFMVYSYWFLVKRKKQDAGNQIFE